MLKARNFCNLTAAAPAATAADVADVTPAVVAVAVAVAVAAAVAKNPEIQPGKQCGNRLSCFGPSTQNFLHRLFSAPRDWAKSKHKLAFKLAQGAKA